MNTDKIYAEQIANEYSAKETSKVKALKRLDAKVKNPAIITAMIVGIASTLLFGLGLCLAMGIIGLGNFLSIGLGIVIGCLGVWGVSINYLLYKAMLNKGKNKYGSDIIELANQIVNEEK